MKFNKFFLKLGLDHIKLSTCSVQPRYFHWKIQHSYQTTM